MRETAALVTSLVLATAFSSGAGALERLGKPGFYGLVKQDGVWWFVTPGGERYVSVGINHVDPLFLLADADRDRSIATYGPDLVNAQGRPNMKGKAVAKFMEQAIDQVRGWGFNALGMHTPQVEGVQLPYVPSLRPARVDGFIHDNPVYPDPFDAATEEAVDEVAKQKLDPLRDDPLVLGVSYSDMTQWRTRRAGIHPWVKTLMALDAKAPGKQEWIRVLKSRYASPAAAARAYGAKLDSWEAIAAHTSWSPATAKDVRADEASMLPRIADAWYGLVTRVARRHDPNHLILGDKLIPPDDVPDWILPIIGKHFDVIYLQWYALAEEQIPFLRRIHERTGRPILMGDSSFSTVEARVPNPKGVRVASQAAVGEAYAKYLERILAESYVVGWHYCGYMVAAPDLARFNKLAARQNGFVRPDGTVYEEAVSRVKAANTRAFGWHEAAKEGEVAPRGPGAPAAPPKGDGVANAAPRGTERRGRPPVVKLHDGPDYHLTRIDGNVYELRVQQHGSSVPVKPVSWIVTGDGVVVYDTGTEEAGRRAHELIREMTDEPIRYIVYSHHHGTQLGGARALLEEGTKVIAHAEFVTKLEDTMRMAGNSRRLNGLQFDLRTPPDTYPLEPWKPVEAPKYSWSEALAPVDRSGRFVFPDEVYDWEKRIELGDVTLLLHHANGEAQDYTILFLPEQRIVFVADLLAGFPMVASPMKEVRDEVAWRSSLEWVKEQKPRAVLSTTAIHTDPAVIAAHLDYKIHLFAFLHAAVLHEIDAGSTIDEAIARIEIPKEARKDPWSKQVYGNLPFAVRGLYQRYSGWFDQNATNLDPVPVRERARSFVATMGGAERVLAEAKRIHGEGNLRLALEYLDLLALDGPHPEAHELKARILDALEHASSHGITRNIYRKSAAIERARAEAARGGSARKDGAKAEPAVDDGEAPSFDD